MLAHFGLLARFGIGMMDAPARPTARSEVFANGDLLTDILSHLPLNILALTAVQVSRGFCAAAQERLRQARPLLAPPFMLSPQDVLGARTAFPVSTPLHMPFGDEGVSVLARAFASGALPQLTHLNLCHHHIGDDGCIALAEACASGALAHLTHLILHSNEIADEGLIALSEACAKGALPQLSELHLHENKICDAGMSAVAKACAGGAMPQVVDKLHVHVHGNPASDEARAKVVDALEHRKRERLRQRLRRLDPRQVKDMLIVHVKSCQNIECNTCQKLRERIEKQRDLNRENGPRNMLCNLT